MHVRKHEDGEVGVLGDYEQVQNRWIQEQKIATERAQDQFKRNITVPLQQWGKKLTTALQSSNSKDREVVIEELHRLWTASRLNSPSTDFYDFWQHNSSLTTLRRRWMELYFDFSFLRDYRTPEEISYMTLLRRKFYRKQSKDDTKIKAQILEQRHYPREIFDSVNNPQRIRILKEMQVQLLQQALNIVDLAEAAFETYKPQFVQRSSELRKKLSNHKHEAAQLARRATEVALKKLEEQKISQMFLVQSTKLKSLMTQHYESFLLHFRQYRAEVLQLEKNQPPTSSSSSSSSSFSNGHRIFTIRGNNGSLAAQVNQEFASLKMADASRNVVPGSGCNQNEQGKKKLKPYQEIVGKLIQPVFDVNVPTLNGILVAHEMGSGKTRTGWECIAQWFSAFSFLKNNVIPIQPVIVLLPESSLFENWIGEADVVLAPRFNILKVIHHSKTTVVLHLSMSGFQEVFYVVLHQMQVLLPDSVLRLFNNTRVYEQYELTRLTTDEAFTKQFYTEEQWGLLKLLEEEQIKEIQKHNPRQQLPEYGLVLIDEVHNIPNPSEKINSVTDATTILGWVNAIHRQRFVMKRVFLTGTLMLNEERLPDLFKLLNLTVGKIKAFEGAWRRAPHAQANIKVKKVLEYADEVDTQIISKRWNEAFQTIRQKQDWTYKNYSDVLSYITLKNDLTIYPRLSSRCYKDHCTWLFDSKTNDFFIVKKSSSILQESKKLHDDEELTTAQTRKNEEDQTTIIYVTLNKPQEENLKKAMKKDLKQRGVERFQELNYGLSTKKMNSSIHHSFGLKTLQKVWPSKGYALLKLWNLFPKDKHFAYLNTNYASVLTHWMEFLQEKGKFQILSLDKALDSKTEEDWYKTNTPARRLIFCALSPTAKALLTGNELVRRRKLLLAIWNHPSNAHGAYVQVFFGDRTTKEGISLQDTMHVEYIDPSTSEMTRAQIRARVLRICSLRHIESNQWNQIRQWMLISKFSSSSKKKKVKNVKDPEQTNEEYHYRNNLMRRALKASKSVTTLTARDISHEFLGMLYSMAMDCRLFQRYTHVDCFYAPGEANEKVQDSSSNDNDVKHTKTICCAFEPLREIRVQIGSTSWILTLDAPQPNIASSNLTLNEVKHLCLFGSKSSRPAQPKKLLVNAEDPLALLQQTHRYWLEFILFLLKSEPRKQQRHQPESLFAGFFKLIQTIWGGSESQRGPDEILVTESATMKEMDHILTTAVSLSKTCSMLQVTYASGVIQWIVMVLNSFRAALPAPLSPNQQKLYESQFHDLQDYYSESLHLVSLQQRFPLLVV